MQGVKNLDMLKITLRLFDAGHFLKQWSVSESVAVEVKMSTQLLCKLHNCKVEKQNKKAYKKQ